MPKSMTGYGKGESRCPEGKLIVHLKTVNHRRLDVIIRAAQQFLPYEMNIRKMTQECLLRGRVEVYLEWEPNTSMERSWDLARARDYYEQLVNLRNTLEISEPLKMSDVMLGEVYFQTTDVNGTKDLDWWQLIESSLKVALASLSEMRAREGKRLYQDILERARQMEQFEAELESLRQPTKESHRQRILKRIAEFNGQLDESRLMMEIAIMVEKSDYTEELVRLKSHREELCCVESKPHDSVGRRLEFISQEIKREINTIGSKALSPELSRLVVDYKDELEKIREQLQNIE